jgi:hypothetical protein
MRRGLGNQCDKLPRKRRTEVPESTEARWLRENWDPEILRSSENKWIAVREVEVVASGEQLEQVVEEAEGANEGRSKALYAFVFFGELQ